MVALHHPVTWQSFLAPLIWGNREGKGVGKGSPWRIGGKEVSMEDTKALKLQRNKRGEAAAIVGGRKETTGLADL